MRGCVCEAFGVLCYFAFFELFVPAFLLCDPFSKALIESLTCEVLCSGLARADPGSPYNFNPWGRTMNNKTFVSTVIY